MGICKGKLFLLERGFIHNIHRVINNFVEKLGWIFFIVIHNLVNNLLITFKIISNNTIYRRFLTYLLDIVGRIDFYPQDIGTIFCERYPIQYKFSNYPQFFYFLFWQFTANGFFFTLFCAKIFFVGRSCGSVWFSGEARQNFPFPVAIVSCPVSC